MPPEKLARMCSMLTKRYQRCVMSTLASDPFQVTEKCGGMYLDLTELCGVVVREPAAHNARCPPRPLRALPRAQEGVKPPAPAGPDS